MNLLRCSSAALVASALSAPALAQNTLHVDAIAPANGNGSTWERAFDSLDDALAAARPGDTIWVASGTYTPASVATRHASFIIPEGVQLYGGFKGNERDFEDRPEDPLDRPSILSGEIGTPAHTDNLYNVVRVESASVGVRLDGFVIEGAYADGVASPNRRDGGGVQIGDAPAVLRGLLLRDNFAAGDGGGLALLGPAGLVDLAGCTFESNESGSEGGGMHADRAFVMVGCTFEGNTSSAGGGLAIVGAGFTGVDDCDFESNTASAGGGGLAVDLSDASGGVFLDGCRFVGNTAGLSGGGGVRFAGRGDHSMISCRLLGNDTDALGGGVLGFLDDASDSLTIDNTLVVGNTSSQTGAGIRFGSPASYTLVASTIAGNEPVGVALGPNEGVLITSCILAHNQSPSQSVRSKNLTYSPPATPTLRYSLVLGWDGFFPASNMRSGDPLFVDLDGGDNTLGTPDDNARLMPGSPAIDAGSDAMLSPFVFADIYSQQRIRDDAGTPDTGLTIGVGGIVDMGAAEFQGTTPDPCPADLTGDGLLNNTDINVFVSSFLGQNPLADFNDDGLYNNTDINLFVSQFLAGCG